MPWYTQLNIDPHGAHRQKRVWTRATTRTTAQNKAVGKTSILKFTPDGSYYTLFDAELRDKFNRVSFVIISIRRKNFNSKNKILSVFCYFFQIDVACFNLFLHFQKLEEIEHRSIPKIFMKNTISSFFVRFQHDASLIQSKIASSEYRTTALRFLEKWKWKIGERSHGGKKTRFWGASCLNLTKKLDIVFFINIFGIVRCAISSSFWKCKN